jgi:hypothetical protein
LGDSSGWGEAIVKPCLAEARPSESVSRIQAMDVRVATAAEVQPVTEVLTEATSIPA